MKTLKFISVILLILTLAISLIACGGDEEKCEHKDADDDKLCDKCGEAFDDGEESGGGDGDGVLLIENGEVKFRLVKGADVGAEAMMAIGKFIDRLKDDFGADVVTVPDNVGTAKEIEVLIGTVTSRGEEYMYDSHTLGMEGYAITAIGTKIIVTAGSEAMLGTALTEFFTETLGITDELDELGTVRFTKDDEVIKVQDNYRIKDVTVGGQSIDGYKIVVDRTKNDSFEQVFDEASRSLQSFFYTKTGRWLDIVDVSEFDGEDAIYLRATELGKAGATGFRTRVEDKSLFIECAHVNKFLEAFDTYYNKNLAFARDEVLTLKKYESDMDLTKVRYSEFGAVGDGKTDDANAFIETHAFANIGGQTVYADAGKTYRLNYIAKQIVIKTDVNWNNCKIILDNSNILRDKSGVPAVVGVDTLPDRGFIVVEQDIPDIAASDEQMAAFRAMKDENGIILYGLESKGEHEMTTNIGFSLGYPAMLTVQNDNARNYIRYGYTDSKGAMQTELVLVDEEGNIDESTPILNNFTEATRILIHRIDTRPITIENAVIEELASRVNLNGGYRSISRGIQVKRANTTVQNIEHIIKDEIDPNTPVKMDEHGLAVIAEGYRYSGGKIIDPTGKTYTGDDVKPFTGHSYNGIFSAWRTHNTLVKNVVFQGRVKYIEGTYDIDATYANKTVFENCTQSNFFEEGSTTVPNLSKCWGVSGTNYCKNLEYKNCELTRYDAHAGVVNGRIEGGKLAVLRLIGGGEFVMDGVTVYARSTPFQLREDYGASFNGEFIIKDCTLVDAWGGNGTLFNSGLISLPSIYWDMGYRMFCPNITVDNLKIEGLTGGEIPLFVRDTYTEYQASRHYPHRDIFEKNASDPTVAGYKFHYDTRTPDEWIAENITAEGARFHGCEYTTETTGNGITTVIVTDTVNRFPYVAPDHLTVINNERNGYILTLYKCDFFSSKIVNATSGNLKRVELN